MSLLTYADTVECFCTDVTNAEDLKEEYNSEKVTYRDNYWHHFLRLLSDVSSIFS